MIKYSILQIDLKRDPQHYGFFGSRFALERNDVLFPPPEDIYDAVYHGEQDTLDPEDIYRLLNLNHPSDYKARSLSVSDIIQYHLPNGQKLNLFCDNIGFKAVDFGEDFKIAKEAEYHPASDGSSGTITLFYNKNLTERAVFIKISNILSKRMVGMDDYGAEVVLTPGEVYTSLQTYYLKDPSARETDPISFGDRITQLLF